ncbi:unnamed protein product [Urochloa humidicola]
MGSGGAQAQQRRDAVAKGSTSKSGAAAGQLELQAALEAGSIGCGAGKASSAGSSGGGARRASSGGELRLWRAESKVRPGAAAAARGAPSPTGRRRRQRAGAGFPRRLPSPRSSTPASSSSRASTDPVTSGRAVCGGTACCCGGVLSLVSGGGGGARSAPVRASGGHGGGGRRGEVGRHGRLVRRGAEAGHHGRPERHGGEGTRDCGDVPVLWRRGAGRLDRWRGRARPRGGAGVPLPAVQPREEELECLGQAGAAAATTEKSSSLSSTVTREGKRERNGHNRRVGASPATRGRWGWWRGFGCLPRVGIRVGALLELIFCLSAPTF